MDYGSRPFRCKYRPFRDSDQEVEIEWFPAAPGAKPLGKVSCITNPFWELDQFEYTDGELPLSSVVPTGKPVVRPGTGRGHVCGTDRDFEEGGEYDEEQPPVIYGQQGLPTCCGAPVPFVGGAVDGGVFGVAVTPGPTCETAAVLAPDVPALLTLPTSGFWWVKLPDTPGTQWHLTAEQVAGSPGSLGVSWQTSDGCSGGVTNFGPYLVHGACQTNAATAGADAFMILSTASLTPILVSITAGYGACP